MFRPVQKQDWNNCQTLYFVYLPGPTCCVQISIINLVLLVPGSDPAPIGIPGLIDPAPLVIPGSDPAPLVIPGWGVPGSDPAPLGIPGSDPAPLVLLAPTLLPWFLATRFPQIKIG